MMFYVGLLIILGSILQSFTIAGFKTSKQELKQVSASQPHNGQMVNHNWIDAGCKLVC
jgi:hypothetical protein